MGGASFWTCILPDVLGFLLCFGSVHYEYRTQNAVYFPSLCSCSAANHSRYHEERTGACFKGPAGNAGSFGLEFSEGSIDQSGVANVGHHAELHSKPQVRGPQPNKSHARGVDWLCRQVRAAHDPNADNG